MIGSTAHLSTLVVAMTTAAVPRVSTGGGAYGAVEGSEVLDREMVAMLESLLVLQRFRLGP